MALSGSLHTLSLPEVFQSLHRSQATGVLKLSSPLGNADVVMDQGVIIDLQAGDDRTHSMLERLAATGLYSYDQLDRQIQDRSGNFATLDSLIESGQLDKANVDEALHRHVFEGLCDLFSWDKANFLFRSAGETDQSATHQVEQARLHPQSIEIPSLLMESARLIDEWERIAPDLPDDNQVPEIMPGHSEALEQQYAGYPEMPVMRLVDGMRTIKEIVDVTPVSRMQVHTVLFFAISEGMLRLLDTDELERRAEYYIKKKNEVAASRVLRACLAQDPNRRSATAKLASVLGNISEESAAADCYRQLALGYLSEGHQEQAVEAAEKAVKRDGVPENRMVLVRCFIESGDEQRASQALASMAEWYLAHEQLDDARSTLNKVLEYDSENTEARRIMALVHQAAVEVGQVPDADSVVCVSCGEINPRDRKTCRACDKPLQLTCLTCGRAVALSDNICVFCGANPHVRTAGERLPHSGPTTTAIFSRLPKERTEGSGLRSLLAEARELEAAEKFNEALTLWRVIAEENREDEEIAQHVRELEQVVHDLTVERFIELGNGFRRRRRYVRALRGYNQAMRAISVQDPRRPKLQQLLKATKRSLLANSLIYVTALVAIAGAGWLIVEPQLRLQQLKAEVKLFESELYAALDSDDPDDFLDLTDGWLDFQERSAALGDRSQDVLGTAGALYDGAQRHAATLTLATIEADMAKGEWQRASQAIQEFRLHYDPRDYPKRFDSIHSAIDAYKSAATEAPKQLAHLKELEGNGAWVDALEVATALVTAPDQTVVAESEIIRSRLLGNQEAHLAAIDNMAAVIADDLSQAHDGLAALLKAPEHRAWQTTSRIENLHQQVRKQMEAAQVAYAALPNDIPSLENFIAQYPASQQVAAADKRLSALRQAEASAAQRQQRLLNDYRAARSSTDWGESHRVGLLLKRDYPAFALQHQVQLPLIIEIGLPGVQLMNGAVVATVSSEAGVIEWWYDSEPAQELVLIAEGYEPLELVVDLAREWQLARALERSVAWTWQGSGSIYSVQSAPGSGMVVSAGEEVVRLDQGGAVVWRLQAGGVVNVLADDGRPVWSWITPGLDGQWLIPSAEGLIHVVQDSDGQTVTSFESGLVNDYPRIFINELRGTTPRIGAVVDNLIVGPVDGIAEPLLAAGSCVAGPIILENGLDRLLMVAGIDGILRTIDDTNGQVSHQLDLLASDVSSIQSLTHGHLMVLDGSRVTLVDQAGKRQLWDRPGPPGMIGSVSLTSGYVVATGSDSVVWWDSALGRPLGQLALPGEPVLPAVIMDTGRLMVAIKGDHDHYRIIAYSLNGHNLWQRKISHLPTVMTAIDDQVIIGLADGSLIGLEP